MGHARPGPQPDNASPASRYATLASGLQMATFLRFAIVVGLTSAAAALNSSSEICALPCCPCSGPPPAPPAPPAPPVPPPGPSGCRLVEGVPVPPRGLCAAGESAIVNSGRQFIAYVGKQNPGTLAVPAASDRALMACCPSNGGMRRSIFDAIAASHCPALPATGAARKSAPSRDTAECQATVKVY